MKCCIKLCKNNKYLNNINFCHKHLLLLFSKQIITIQKIYRAYKVRQKIKNIYIKLPKDIQNIILYYIELPSYYNNYYNKIKSIVNKKVNKLLYYNTTNNNIKLNIEYIIQCFYYFNKYNLVFNINELKIFFVISEDLKSNVNNIIYSYINNMVYINELSNVDLIHLIDFQNASFDNLILLSNQIENYNFIYNTFYSITSNRSIKYI